MDLAELKARAAAALEFSVTIDGRNFTLRLPTGQALVLAKRSSEQWDSLGPNATPLVLQRLLTEAAIVGWAGVTVEDILPGQPEAAEPVPYAVEAIGLVLDAKPKWALLLGTELYERIVARSEAAAVDAKN